MKGGVIDWGIDISGFNLTAIVISVVSLLIFIGLPVRNIIRYVQAEKQRKHDEEFGVPPEEDVCTTNNISSKEQYLKNHPTKTTQELKEYAEDIEEPKELECKTVRNLLIFVSSMVSIFVVVAILCIVNALVPEPFLEITSNDGPAGEGKDSWRIGVVILCFLLPSFFWIAHLIKKMILIKNNKPIKASPFTAYYLFFFVIIALGCGPLLFSSNIDSFWTTGGSIYFGFLGFMLAVCVFGFIYTAITYSLDQAILNHPEKYGTKATFIACKFASSSTQTVNGVVVSEDATYQVQFSYVDERGIERTRWSSETYYARHAKYLQYKKTFSILAKGKRAIITEDLKNVQAPDDISLNMSPIAPHKKTLLSFLQQNYWTQLFLYSLPGIILFEVFGALLRSVTLFGYLVIGMGGILLIASLIMLLPKSLAEIKGRESMAKLLELTTIDYSTKHQSSAPRKYAVVEIDGKPKHIYLPREEWFIKLASYVQKDIPLRVLGKVVIVDMPKIH